MPATASHAGLLQLYRELTANIAAEAFLAMSVLGAEEEPFLLSLRQSALTGLHRGAQWCGFDQQDHKRIPINSLHDVAKWAAWASAELISTPEEAANTQKGQELLLAAYGLLASIDDFFSSRGIPAPIFD